MAGHLNFASKNRKTLVGGAHLSENQFTFNYIIFTSTRILCKTVHVTSTARLLYYLEHIVIMPYIVLNVETVNIYGTIHVFTVYSLQRMFFR